ncbi:hypothetical protein N0V90_000459 [Kalmusia sp. IMI 367209]|nr:hypothetical protein N0V90_000459 [Kalmusia sp. IMI 367209]
MSKSPRDSTRFTATGVWAHTKPGGRATTLQFADPAPKNETPQQKVKRLRDAANRAKMAQVTKWDYMYLYGRMAADAAHRFTVYGIIFATGCIGVLAVFSIGDMVVYNRRKRAIFFEDQEREQAKILALARDAVLSGSATPAQTALVEGIAEEERLMEIKKAERKLPSRMLWFLHGDWNEDKSLKEQRRLAVEDFQKKEGEASQSGSVTQAVQAAHQARLNSAEVPPIGGPLDQQAAKATAFAENTAKGVSRGWFGWILGGSKKE